MNDQDEGPRAVTAADTALKLEGKAIRARMVPAHLADGLARFVVLGIKPGHFLSAVLANDLAGAFGRGDETALAALRNIMRYLENDAPAACWGTKAKVRAWGGLI